MFVTYLCLCCIYVFDVFMFVMYLCLCWIYVCDVFMYVMCIYFVTYLFLSCIYVCDVLFFWCNFVSDGIFVTKKDLFLCMYLIVFQVVFYGVCVFCLAEQSVLCLFFVCLAEYSFVCSVCFTCLASFLIRCLYWYYGFPCFFTLPVLLFAFIIGFVYVVCICFPVSIWAFLSILVSIQNSMCE